SAKANMVEHAGSSSKAKGKGKMKNDKKGKGKAEYLAPKARIVKQKFQGTCYNYDQPVVGGLILRQPVTCVDKSMFHSFSAVDNGEKLYMGNSATADIKGEGYVILKMTSEKEFKLTNGLWGFLFFGSVQRAKDQSVLFY
nr:zinc finger, CCHC-type [Tanacetum cinerariifolium]